MGKYVKILLATICVLWIIFIGYNSSQIGQVSNEKSKGVTEVLINNVQKIIENTTLNDKIKNVITRQELNNIIRKIAHVFEFFILAILIHYFMKSLNIKNREVIIYTLFIIVLYAVIDEFRQLYIVGRSSQVKDVIIDFIGGSIGVIFSQIGISVSRIVNKKVKLKEV